MSQIANIVKSTLDVLGSNADLATKIPGGFHHGTQLRSEAARPYALVICKEIDNINIFI